MQRRCAKCKGPVTLNRLTTKIPHPHDPNREIEVQGLGTWHCVNGCRPRTVTVPTFIGAGKQSEVRAQGIDYAIRDEYIVPRERRRPIAVEFGHPHTSNKSLSVSA